MRGRIDLFSIDTLIDMLAKLGIRAKVVLQPSRRRARVAWRPRLSCGARTRTAFVPSERASSRPSWRS